MTANRATLVAALLTGLAGCAVQPPADPLDAARRALGGDLDLAPGEGLVIRATGIQDRGAELQGSAPGSRNVGDLEETIVLRADGAVAYEYRAARDDGTGDWIREIYDAPRDRLIVVMDQGFSVRLRNDANLGATERMRRRLPQVLVAAPGIVTRGDTLVIPASNDATGPDEELVVTLGEDSLPVAVGYSADLFGPTHVVWTFDDYRPVSGIGLVPHAYAISVNGALFTEMRVQDAEVRNVDEWFALPTGVAEPRLIETSAAGSESAGDVEELAPGVYRALNVRGGFSPWFIDLGDAVVAIDAPAGYPILNELPAGDFAPGDTPDWPSRAFVERIQRQLPERPLRSVVLTHFHWDHAGGAGAFVDAGAQVFAPAEQAAPISALLEAKGYDAESASVTAVGERMVFEGPARRVEILPLAPGPHADEMLVAWIPDAGLLLVSDVFNPAPIDAYPSPGYAAVDAAFADELDRLGIRPTRIQSMHTSFEGTSEHLAAARRSLPIDDRPEPN